MFSPYVTTLVLSTEEIRWWNEEVWWWGGADSEPPRGVGVRGKVGGKFGGNGATMGL